MAEIEERKTDKKMVIALVCLAVIAAAALAIATAGYLREPVRETTVINRTVISTPYQGPIYTGTANGFIITFENGVTFYFTGDTCLFGDMKFLSDYYKPDVTFLPIGNVFTMDPQDAAYATTLINSKFAVPYHYHIFPFLAQNATEFVQRVDTYRQEGKTRTVPIVLEPGVTQDISGIKVTWLGHGSFIFDSVNGTRILVDPWLKPNPDCPPEYKNTSAFKKVDLILLTHGHVDHWELSELVDLTKKYNPVFLTQFELGNYLDHRFSDYNVKGILPWMNKGGHITKDVLVNMVPPGTNVDFMGNMSITMVQAEHSSSPP
jgi:L-ascorbate metabolism protein UlaG (beta-lactamase superfamily)